MAAIITRRRLPLICPWETRHTAAHSGLEKCDTCNVYIGNYPRSQHALHSRHVLLLAQRADAHVQSAAHFARPGAPKDASSEVAEAELFLGPHHELSALEEPPEAHSNTHSHSSQLQPHPSLSSASVDWLGRDALPFDKNRWIGEVVLSPFPLARSSSPGDYTL